MCVYDMIYASMTTERKMITGSMHQLTFTVNVIAPLLPCSHAPIHLPCSLLPCSPCSLAPCPLAPLLPWALVQGPE